MKETDQLKKLMEAVDDQIDESSRTMAHHAEITADLILEEAHKLGHKKDWNDAVADIKNEFNRLVNSRINQSFVDRMTSGATKKLNRYMK